jgi:hypothetical protein
LASSGRLLAGLFKILIIFYIKNKMATKKAAKKTTKKTTAKKTTKKKK